MTAQLAPVETPEPFFPHVVNNDRDSILDNIRANSVRGLPELTQHPFVDTPLAIVGGGPSVTGYLPILKAIMNGGHVLSVNGAYKFLRERGIESDHFLLLDSRRDNLCHVDSPGDGTMHYLASQVHPACFDALSNHDVTLFHPGTDTAMEVMAGQDKDFLTAPIGMASVYAVYVAAALGYRNLFLFGYDFSHIGEDRYAFDQPMNRKDDVIDIHLNGQTFQTTTTLARTADQFVNSISPVMRACELNVKVMSKGLLSAMIDYSQNPATADSEREKYEQIWDIDAYHKVSPGLNYIEQAVEVLAIPRGSRVADFGCGTGRATKWLIDHGYDGIGIDIAGNALEEDVPFVQSALWNELPSVEYGFSTDVLEHIPPEKVRLTLQRIHDACSEGCYLNIDTIPDSFGVLVGKRLHLTVMSAEDWEYELKQIWGKVDAIYTDDKQAIFVCTQ